MTEIAAYTACSCLPRLEREEGSKADTASLSNPSRLSLVVGWRYVKLGGANNNKEIVVGDAPSTFNTETLYDSVVGSRLSLSMLVQEEKVELLLLLLLLLLFPMAARLRNLLSVHQATSLLY